MTSRSNNSTLNAEQLLKGMAILEEDMARPQKKHHNSQGKRRNTRESLIEAVLVLSRHKNFFSISMRELTREIGMSPASFYGHFDSMEQLAVAIIDETMGTLNELLRDARSPKYPRNQHGFNTINSVIRLFSEKPDHYRFVVALFNSGSAKIQSAIDAHWSVMLADIRNDLKQYPYFANIDSYAMDLCVKLLAQTSLEIAFKLSVSETTNVASNHIVNRGADELRLICVGAVHWKGKSA